MCNCAWNKLNKYYNLIETSVVYIAAVVLDPRVKWVFYRAMARLDFKGKAGYVDVLE